MASAPSTGRRGEYGFDAPPAVIALSLVVTIGTVGAIVLHSRPAAASAAMSAVILALFVHTTRRGKFEVWRDVLDELALRGDERVLDLGCGRGAILLMAAARLTTGRAIGVDLWRTIDQSGNALAVTEANARAEGVSDRIELHTADMTSLPFPDDSFDVIISNVAIHNIPSAAGRDKAIDEAMRVLKPGGRLRITDIKKTGAYRRRLASLGAVNITSHGVGWRMWWGGPWMATQYVGAGKKGP